MNKLYKVIGVLLILALSIAFHFATSSNDMEDFTDEIDNAVVTEKASLYNSDELGAIHKYNSSEYGLAFEYPKTWTLDSVDSHGSVDLTLSKDGYEIRFYLTKEDIEGEDGGIIRLESLGLVSYLVRSEEEYLLVDVLSESYEIPYAFGGVYYLEKIEDQNIYATNAIYNGKYSIIVNYGTPGELSEEIADEIYFIITNINTAI